MLSFLCSILSSITKPLQSFFLFLHRSLSVFTSRSPSVQFITLFLEDTDVHRTQWKCIPVEKKWDKVLYFGGGYDLLPMTSIWIIIMQVKKRLYVNRGNRTIEGHFLMGAFPTPMFLLHIVGLVMEFHKVPYLAQPFSLTCTCFSQEKLFGRLE